MLLPDINHRYGVVMPRDEFSAANLISSWEIYKHVHRDKSHKDFTAANMIAVRHRVDAHKISAFRKSVDFIKQPKYDHRPTAS